jgi:thiopeptide-type bacteriocin biosynthesis protein
MTRPRPERGFSAADFFALRTPLLPFEELEAWAAGLRGPATPEAELTAAVASDRELLRERLRRLVERPELAEALFVASPSLCEEGLPAWRRDPDGKKGRRAEGALVRYLLRLAARPTPFGLFAGCSLGRIDGAAATRLELAPRGAYRRHTRLDMDYLFALAEDLGQQPERAAAVLYRPNSSLYRAAGRWRYAEARLVAGRRSYHLVAVEPSPYLDATLERAAAGARRDELAAALAADDPDGEITREDALAYVDELIASQLLVAPWSPRVTGGGAAVDLAAALEAAGDGAAAAALHRAVAALAVLDGARLGNPVERYRAVAEGLSRELPTAAEVSRLFQVDMVKPAPHAVLGGELLAEMERGIELLHRLSGEPRDETWARFREAFTERFGDRPAVPLLEVLDEETGIGFGTVGGAAAEASPLLAGLPFPGPRGNEAVPWGTREGELLRLLTGALAAGSREVVLGEDHLTRLAEGTPAPLPDAFHLLAVVAAPSPAALERGDFRLLLKNAAGPSGARLLGRFCHADPALEAGVRAHLAAEEALRPDAVFAEVVHLPQGRIGNILARPLLRAWEIPFLGRGAVPEDHQLPVQDLAVSVVGRRVVLTSRRLSREVLPRLTSAHNFVTGSLGVYRFLCALQSQGTAATLGWSWGPLAGAPFLPRVRVGRLVLERARWRLTEEEIRELAGRRGAALVAAARRLRERRGLPRWVELTDGDNELLVDLENVLALEGLVDVLEGRPGAVLAEPFPAPEELVTGGPEGRFTQEVLVPFVRRRPATPVVWRPVRQGDPVAVDRLPGSEWLFAKIYTGAGSGDGVLRRAVAPVVRAALASGAARSWFFLRYGDPRWHLRVRFEGDPVRLQGEVLPRLQEALEPLLATGQVWRLAFDTYQREVARYGGPAGTAVAERLFWADSEAVLAIVELLEGDAGLDARWRLALRGVATILDYLGLDPATQLAVAGRLRESYSAEFRADRALKKALGDRHRRERAALAELFDPARAAAAELAPGLAALEHGARLAAPAAAELRALERDGQLTASVEELAPSFVHMHTNRLLRSEGRAHELVLYELLFRLLTERAKRG